MKALIAVVATFGLCASLAGAKPLGSLDVLFNFDEDEGSYPDTDLVMDAQGNLYGMTVTGGDFNGGTVFQLAPAPSGWTHTVLHHFTGGADGGQPYGGVTLDASDNVYGTAVIGGSGGVCVEDGCGVVFKITKSDSRWTFDVIHDFTGADGFGPGGPVSLDNLGNVYGMTPTGGDYGAGVIFQLAPQRNGKWTRTILHHFTGGEDGGSGSAGRLLIDADRHIFGVATVGGASGVGVAFELAPLENNDWDYDVFYSFIGAPGGVFPYGGLVRDAEGNFYGTTYYGGSADVGVVYELQKVGDTWNEEVLHDFVGGDDGASSISGLVFLKGRLYGTSSEGGSGCNCGTIFELTPVSGGLWDYSVAYAFTGIPDGAYPYAGLLVGPDDKLYGATVYGGDDNDGTVFEFVRSGGPPQCPADINGDGSVGADDLAMLLGQWGGAGSADLDRSGTVDAEDLATLLGAWGGCA